MNDVQHRQAKGDTVRNGECRYRFYQWFETGHDQHQSEYKQQVVYTLEEGPPSYVGEGDSMVLHRDLRLGIELVVTDADGVPDDLVDDLAHQVEALVLAGANHPGDDGVDDGLVTAEEAGWLDLSECDMVVLSACETGTGRVLSGAQRSLRERLKNDNKLELTWAYLRTLRELRENITMELSPELEAVRNEYMRLAQNLWDGVDDLAPSPMRDRELFAFLGFD